MDSSEKKDAPHRRRVRYSGTHPKHFHEKYKELDPEKYAEDVAHVIARGATPAGMHISIMVQEILDLLRIRPGETGLDATLGYGGHTKAMLEQLQGQGHLYALDVDPIESAKTRARLAQQGYGEEILTVRLQNFAEIGRVAAETGRKFDFILADLGVSSMQIDNPARGFTFKAEGPLDLRLNPLAGIPASERLKQLSRDEIEGMLRENADEPYADRIAAVMMQWRRKRRPLETTLQLRDCVAEALSFLPESERREAVKKSCQRTAQAIRIDVNSEFESLDAFLSQLPAVLAPGGRVAILTFHSGEDRMVKQYFRLHRREGLYSDAAEEVIRPSAEECARNSRARSTKLRWAIRAAD